MDEQKLMMAVADIARRAGHEIMQVYAHGAHIDVSIKSDDSPLTEADTRANELIMQALHALTPDTPILSEESAATAWQQRQHWSSYWLVDPLDGTKEFISRNGEFTVNIALVRKGEPVLGVVLVPVTGCCYFGFDGLGAWRQDQQEPALRISSGSWPAADHDHTLRVVASRRHGGEALTRILTQLQAHYPRIELVNMGSSLKICLLAEGKADLYARLAPTSEWDTAAAHAILRAAGGEIYQPDFSPLRYNQKESLLNPHFIAMAGQDPSHLQTILAAI
ncbi:MAG: 3'(2'),5'-bisphosphate nucleotidase CysQ [Pseudomonadales bacterium]|nr:3'(2'),5'-bisphosphate nucleotidase CysQ [Pseudomonadales bacterium]